MDEPLLCAQHRRAVLEALHHCLRQGFPGEDALWQVVLAHQGQPYRTASGLPFSYQVKRKKDGSYSGELLISRKEDSKTLTRSSVLLAYRRVVQQAAGAPWTPPFFKGPKAIGQIFGISYLYSLFWNWALIQVPQHLEGRLRQDAPPL